MTNFSNSDLGRFVREASEATKVATPEQVVAYLRQHIYTPWEAFEQEEMWTLLLNNRSQITHEVLAYRGTVKNILVRPAELFRAAIRCNAVGLIVAHNHPSNDPTPSDDDLRFTRELREAATLLGFDFHDHLILGGQDWTSLRQLGY